MSGQGGTVEVNAAACKARCAGVGGCAHFTFWHSFAYTNCHLQDTNAAIHPVATGAGRTYTGGPGECPEGTLEEKYEMYNAGGFGLSGGIDIVDADGDGDLDIAFGNWNGMRVNYVEQLGSGPPVG